MFPLLVDHIQFRFEFRGKWGQLLTLDFSFTCSTDASPLLRMSSVKS